MADYGPLQGDFGNSEHRTISYEGFRAKNKDGSFTTIPWRNFAGYSRDEQTGIMTQSGLSQAEQTQLLDLLAKNKGITWKYPDSVAAATDSGKEWADPGYGTLSNQILGEQQAAAAAASQKKQMQAEGGLPADPSKPAPPAGNAPTTVNAPISTQALNDYVSSVVMPLMKNYQSLVNGDMAQWGGMINQIKAGSAGASTNFATPNLQMLGQLQNLYGQAAMTDQVLSPYLNMVNQTIGQNVKIGMAKETIGAGESLLQQTAATTPMLQQLLSQSGTGALGNASNILQQIASGQTPPLGAGK